MLKSRLMEAMDFDRSKKLPQAQEPDFPWRL